MKEVCFLTNDKTMSQLMHKIRYSKKKLSRMGLLGIIAI